MENISAGLNIADYIIIGVIIFSTLISLVRGFVKEAISLTTWIIAIWLAFKFAPTVSPMLAKYVTSSNVQYIAAFAMVMVSTLIIGALINYFFSMLVSKTGLGGTDRLIGILFGAARGILLVAVLLLVGQMSDMNKQGWWVKSRLVPEFNGIVTWLKGMLPEDFEDFSKYLDSNSLKEKANEQSVVNEASTQEIEVIQTQAE